MFPIKTSVALSITFCIRAFFAVFPNAAAFHLFARAIQMLSIWTSHSSPTCRPINHAMRSNAAAILSITSGSFIEVHQLHKYSKLILVGCSKDDFRTYKNNTWTIIVLDLFYRLQHESSTCVDNNCKWSQLIPFYELQSGRMRCRNRTWMKSCFHLPTNSAFRCQLRVAFAVKTVLAVCFWTCMI